jgi:hypothetical protein
VVLHVRPLRAEMESAGRREAAALSEVHGPPLGAAGAVEETRPLKSAVQRTF